MKRKTSELPTRVYKFGCAPPVGETARLVSDQLYAANCYYNRYLRMIGTLTRIYRRLRAKHYPELAKLEAREREISAILDAAGEEKQIKALKRQRTALTRRMKRAAQAGRTAEHAALKTERTRLDEEIKELKRSANAPLREELRKMSPRLKELREQADADKAAGDKEFKLRLGVVYTNAVAPRRAAVYAEMCAEPQWSDWWKAATAHEDRSRDVKNTLRKRASNGLARRPRYRGANGRGEPRGEPSYLAAIYHGTHDLCEASARAAWRDYRALIANPETPALTRMAAIKRGRPKYRHADGSGVLRVQVTGGERCGAVCPPESEPFYIGGRQVQVELQLKRPWSSRGGRNVPPTPGSKRQLRLADQPGWGIARVRIGSHRDPEESPVWGELPVRIHRRPPACAIRWAMIVATRLGQQLRWEFQLVLEHESFGKLPAGEGAAVVNYGWRSKGLGAFRVAYAIDTEGNHHELVVDRTASALAFADELRSTNDLHFNAAREVLVTALAEHPEWFSAELQERLDKLPQWRSARRLRRWVRGCVSEMQLRERCQELWQQWKADHVHATSSEYNRFWRMHRRVQRGVASPQERAEVERLGEALRHPDLLQDWDSTRRWCEQHGETGARALVIYLDIWSRKHDHLDEWQCFQRRKSIGARREHVRAWTRQLCERYAVVDVEDYDLRRVPGACIRGDDEDEQTKRARKNRTRCSPGEARAIMVSFGGAKVELNKTTAPEGEGASQRCTRCGGSAPTQEGELMVTCPHCGYKEDIDIRNCTNRLRERGGARHFPGGSRKGSTAAA